MCQRKMKCVEISAGGDVLKMIYINQYKIKPANVAAYSYVRTRHVLENVKVRTNEFISGCAVARRQYLGQNNSFTQQPPRLRAAQHAIFGAQHFSPQAILLLCTLSPPETAFVFKARFF